MDKNVYKSAVEQIAFDEQLEKKIIYYLADNSGGITMKRKKLKMNFSTLLAVTACTIFMVSGVSYAAIMHFRNVTHIKNGLVAQSGDDSIDVSNSEMFLDTNEVRNKMLKDGVEMVLLTKEIGSNEVNWSEKRVWKDETPAYYSKDGIEWERDETVAAGIMTEYVYTQYEMATKDAQMPNIIKNLESKLKMKYGAFEEYATEVNSNVLKKRIIGEFTYREGKIVVDLLKLDHVDTGAVVYTGVETTTNQRTYRTQDGMTYQLSDQLTDGDTETTTLVSNGAYHLIIQFEGLSEKEIQTLLDEIDLSGLEIK